MAEGALAGPGVTRVGVQAVDCNDTVYNEHLLARTDLFNLGILTLYRTYLRRTRHPHHLGAF